jgi:hypothetical protein
MSMSSSTDGTRPGQWGRRMKSASRQVTSGVGARKLWREETDVPLMSKASAGGVEKGAI